MPAFAPNTAARNQPTRSTTCCSSVAIVVSLGAYERA
jgi:hypothetical protein